MEQHPIPRQITTFEFKLIGFLTLKQFIYLIVFTPLGFIVFRVFPVPFLNIVLGAMVAGIGAAFAFVPINDRPLDVWIRNLMRRVTSPTQYMYHKENKPIYFLGDLYFAQDPHRAMTHIESRQKLSAYLAQTGGTNASAPVQAQSKKKQQISNLFKEHVSLFMGKKNTPPPKKEEEKKPAPAATSTQNHADPAQPLPVQPQTAPSTIAGKPTFLTGVIKNHKLIPLPGILVYVKDPGGNVVRLLKTNPHGVFATFNPLDRGEYAFEPKDPRKTYFFDTMKLMVENANQKPIEIFSRELL